MRRVRGGAGVVGRWGSMGLLYLTSEIVTEVRRYMPSRVGDGHLLGSPLIQLSYILDGMMVQSSGPSLPRGFVRWEWAVLVCSFVHSIYRRIGWRRLSMWCFDWYQYGEVLVVEEAA